MEFGTWQVLKNTAIDYPYPHLTFEGGWFDHSNRLDLFFAHELSTLRLPQLKRAEFSLFYLCKSKYEPTTTTTLVSNTVTTCCKSVKLACKVTCGKLNKYLIQSDARTFNFVEMVNGKAHYLSASKGISLKWDGTDWRLA